MARKPKEAEDQHDTTTETVARLDAAAHEVRLAASAAQSALAELAALTEAYDAAVAEAVDTARQAGEDTSIGRTVQVSGRTWHRPDVGIMLAEVVRRVAEARLSNVHGLRALLAQFGRAERHRITDLVDDLPPVPPTEAAMTSVAWPQHERESNVYFGSEHDRREAERRRDQAYIVRPIGRY